MPAATAGSGNTGSSKGAYDDAAPVDHPVYGALAIGDGPYGPAARFGSSLLRLRPHVAARTTFAYPDSFMHPSSFGVAGQMGLIELWRSDHPADPLDHYIEAHVHGGVSVPSDVEALVLDPSFRGSGLDEMARAAGLQVTWHPGYELHTDSLIDLTQYRGPSVANAAAALAENGVITPAILGQTRRGGTEDTQMQKWLWHCLARFGQRE